MTVSRYLIVNADDYGVTDSVNEAVEECLATQRITSASLLVNGPSHRRALDYAGRHPGASIGLHVNLTHFASASGNAMLAPGGRFPGLAALARLQLTQAANFQRACHEEIRAQLRVFTETSGRLPSHIDSHLWVQFLPGVFAAMLDVAAEHGIDAVRMVDTVGQPQATAAARRLSGGSSAALRGVAYQLAKVVLIETSARVFRHRRRLDRRGLFGPAIHAGVVEGLLYQDVETRLRVYDNIVRNLPRGQVVELVVHPGGKGGVPDMHYDPNDAAIERSALLSDEWPAILARHDTRLLTRFGQAPALQTAS